MSLLRCMDKSFRNIMATWGGSQRSQAALICRARKMKHHPQPSRTAPLPPWAAHVRGCHGAADANTRITGCGNGNKLFF